MNLLDAARQLGSGLRRPSRRASAFGLVVIAALLVAGLTFCGKADAAPGAGSVQIPDRSFLYRFKLEREAAAVWGLDAPVALMAAQIHQESRWKPKAASKYAQGLAQFTPSTAKWLPTVCPDVGAPDPWDPDWAIRALICYDHWLHARAPGVSACDRWAFTLSAYNGGEKWVRRDRVLASAAGADPGIWFDHVENHSGRAAWAKAENRGYVDRILRVLLPAYLAASWPGSPLCVVES